MTNGLTRTPRVIRALALSRQPGAIVVAEQAVDLHAAQFRRSGHRKTALEALSTELNRIGRAEPDLVAFLSQVESYIGLLQQRPRMAA